jgi:hypothetical protein
MIKIADFQQSRPIVDKEGRPFADFLRGINTAFRTLVNNANATNAALEAAGIAIAAAAVAEAAAVNVTESAALANSYVTGLTITATDAGASVTVNLSAHTRVYATSPMTSVSVLGGNVTGLAYSTEYYFYYDQASRLGGAVTYVVTTNLDDVAQLGNRHSVGTVITPAAAAPPSNGGGTRPPGGSFAEP